MKPIDLHAILTAYEVGRRDAMVRGVYQNPYRQVEGPQAAAYKRGYDRGITEWCNANGLSEEGVE